MRIRSMCSGEVLLVVETGEDGALDGVHLFHGVDGEKLVLLLIETEDGSGLSVVGAHSLDEGLLVVIRSLDESITGLVVLALNLGRVELDVVRSAGSLVNTAAFNSLDEDLVINLELNNLIDALALSSHHRVELLSLNGSSGEAIEEHAVEASRRGHVLLEQTDDELVVDEATSGHDILGLLAELSASGNGISEHVAGSEMADAKILGDGGSLSALAGTGRTNQDNVHLGLGGANGASLNLGHDGVSANVLEIHDL